MPIVKATVDAFDGTLFDNILGFHLDLGEMGTGGVTHALGVIEMDAILQHKFFKPRNPFRFLAAFENVTWAFILFSVILLAGFFALTGRVRSFWRNLEKTLWSLFGPFKIKARKVALLVAAVWVTMVWILQQYFGGDMLTTMMQPPQDDVIDTLDQLARTVGKTIWVTSTEVYGQSDQQTLVDNYYKGYSFREGLIPKTKIVDYLKTLQSNAIIAGIIHFFEERFGPKEARQSVLLGPRSLAEYAKNIDNRFRKALYVSKEAGDNQPFFYLYFAFSNLVMIRGMNSV